MCVFFNVCFSMFVFECLGDNGSVFWWQVDSPRFVVVSWCTSGIDGGRQRRWFQSTGQTRCEQPHDEKPFHHHCAEPIHAEKKNTAEIRQSKPWSHHDGPFIVVHPVAQQQFNAKNETEKCGEKQEMMKSSPGEEEE